jgi:hypothetical protein
MRVVGYARCKIMRILVEVLKGRGHFGNIDIDGRGKLKFVLKK